MFEKRIFIKAFLLIGISTMILWMLSACSGDGGTETSRRGSAAETSGEPYRLTGVYHLSYLPTREEDGYLVRESEYEWRDGAVVQHCVTEDWDSSPHIFRYKNITYDCDGNAVSSQMQESTADNRVSWLSADGTLFYWPGHEAGTKNHTDITLFLDDRDGNTIASTDIRNWVVAIPGLLHLRSCMGYYLAYSSNCLRVYDSGLNLVAAREFSVSIPGAWIIADFQRYNETTLLIRFEIEEFYISDPSLKELQAYILYEPETDTVMELGSSLQRTEETRGLREIFYTLEDPTAENPSLIPYFSLQDGIYRQDNGVNTLLLHFGNSGLNPERLHILQALPNDRFLAEYTNPLTELTQTVFLIPAPDTVTHAKPVTIAAVSVTRNGGYGMLTDMVTIFNQSQEEYRVSLRAYGLNNSYFTKNTNETFSELEKDIIEGNFCDLYIFGLCPYDVNAIDMYESLLDKNVFLDLEDLAAAAGILPSVTEAYRVHGTVSSLPLWMWYETLYTTDIQRMAETEYGTARLNAETDALKKGELYLGYDYDLKIVREVGLCSFYDREAGTCSFDTEEFLTFLSCMDRLSADYVTKPEEYADFSRAQEQRMLADGSLLYGMTELMSAAEISEFLYTVQDTPFAYAGFPLLGKSVYIRSDLAAAVMKNTAVPDGAKAFLAFLFSDDVQTGKAMAALGLPVTERALTAAFPVGYNYYFADTLTQTPQYQKHSNVRLSEENRAEMTEALITTEQRDDFLDYLRTARLHRAGGDKTILSIIEEELSAADAGVRSRADAAKIIQNRVSIYLSE